MTVASLDAKNAINPENLNATTVTHMSGMRAVPESRDGASGSEARNNVKRKSAILKLELQPWEMRMQI